MKRLIDWLIAAAVIVAVGSAYMLDGHAMKIEALTPRPTDATAYRLCAAIGGPNAWFVYTDSGKLVCVNKRGNKLKEQPAI